MFNNFFNFGSPFSTYSDPFYNQRFTRPNYYEAPRYYKAPAPTRNYYESDSTDSDDEYQQPIKNIKTVPKYNYNLRPRSTKMDLEENKHQQPKNNLNKNKLLDFLETSDSDSEYEKQIQKKVPQKKAQQKVQQNFQSNQSKQKYQDQPKQKQEELHKFQQQPQQQKQEPKNQKQQNTQEFQQFHEDPKQIVDGICIESNVQEDDFPDYYASAKRTRKINESDNYVIKLSPLGELFEKQLQEQQYLQACQ